MNRLQEVEFRLLKEFVDICEKLKLEYFLVCGSALGAVKYKGFIPWDDDIDVALYRTDYEVFCQKAPELLKDTTVLQTCFSDTNYPFIFAKLRNSGTTYIETSCQKLDINQGVYIDVFPLDGYPKEEKDKERVEKAKSKFQKKELCVFDIELSRKQKTVAIIEKILGWHKSPSRHAIELTELLSKYSIRDSDYICNHGNWQGIIEYAPKEQYGKGIWTSFEGLSVRIPENYDAYLTQKYGDWRKELPIEEQVGHHYYTICDLDRPYTYYTNKDNNNTK